MLKKKKKIKEKWQKYQEQCLLHSENKKVNILSIAEYKTDSNRNYL